MSDLNGSVLILAHSRAQLLDDLFNSIFQINAINSYPLIVVVQTGHREVGEVVEKWRSKIDFLIETDGGAKTTAENIARNRLSGYAIAFEAIGADWVLALEDDVIVAPDIFGFIEFILAKFYKAKRFRGINLGSKLVASDLNKNTYCQTRFGIFGQAAVLTKPSWNKMKWWGIIDRSRLGHWDSGMEQFMKTGMTIAPNNSRYIDRGWGGTHASSDMNDEYFIKLSKSYVGNLDVSDLTYYEKDLGYWWRDDLKKFKKSQSLQYWGIFLITSPPVARIYWWFYEKFLIGFSKIFPKNLNIFKRFYK